MISPNTSSVLLWTVLVQTVLLTVTPYVQTASTIPVGWRENVPLLVAFLIVPLTAAYIVQYGKERIGAVLLLSFLPAGVFANIQFLRLSFSMVPPPDASPVWRIVYMSLLLMVVIVQLGGAIMSAIVLRNAHRSIASQTEP